MPITWNQAEADRVIHQEQPFKINGVTVLNDINGNRVQTMDSSSTQYLTPLVNVTVYIEGSYDIYWKLFSNGQLTSGTNSPNGYSFKDTVQLSRQNNQYYLSGWGSSTPGHWGAGDYRYEFYYSGQLVYSHNFRIEDARQTSTENGSNQNLPFEIKGVTVINIDSQGNRIPTMDSSTTQYLQPIVYISVNKEGDYDVYWKLFVNDQLSTGTISPDGYSFKDTIHLSKYGGQYYLSGWGASTSGNWGEGEYRYEFYYLGQCIYSHSFDISKTEQNPEQTLQNDDSWNSWFDTNYKDKDINTIKKLAECGDSDAQIELANRYDEGEGVPQSDYMAVKWITKAATLDNSQGQLLLGFCYMEGNVVKKDEYNAFKWFYKSAGQGNAVGQYMLSICYEEGTGTPINESEALKWLTMAAEQNYSVAQCELGLYYEELQDYHLAVDWYSKAVNQGNRDAQYALGLCYYNGKGVRIDYDRAFKLIKQAAAQGNEEAIKFAKEHNLK